MTTAPLWTARPTCGTESLSLCSFACAIGLLAATAWAAAPRPATRPASQPAAHTTVEVRGLCIAKEQYEPDGNNSMNSLSLPCSKGTSISLLVQRPEGGLIAFDEGASKLETFADSTGRSLLPKQNGGFFSKTGFNSFPSIASDAKAAMIRADSSLLPGKDARAIRLKGILAFKTAAKKSVYKQANVPVKLDTKISAGPIPFTITKIGRPDSDNNGLEITLQSKRDIENVASIRFLNQDGGEIKADRTQTSFTKIGSMGSHTQTYSLAERVDTISIEIACWEDMKTVKIPFDLTATLGMGD